MAGCETRLRAGLCVSQGLPDARLVGSSAVGQGLGQLNRSLVYWWRPWSWVWSRRAPKCSGAGGWPDALASDRRDGFVFVPGWRSSFVASSRSSSPGWPAASPAPKSPPPRRRLRAGRGRRRPPGRAGRRPPTVAAPPRRLEPVSVSIWQELPYQIDTERGFCALPTGRRSLAGCRGGRLCGRGRWLRSPRPGRPVSPRLRVGRRGW